MSSAATLERFCARALATGAVLHRCADAAAARAVVGEILSGLATTSGGSPSVAATGPAAALLPEGVAPVGAEARPPYLDLAVSTAVLGVAETGGVLLAPRTRWDRLLGVLARTHAIALAEAAVRDSLDDVAAAVRDSAAPYLSLVTGPTRTADIERVITVGAHGPAVVHLLLLAEPPPDA